MPEVRSMELLGRCCEVVSVPSQMVNVECWNSPLKHKINAVLVCFSGRCFLITRWSVWRTHGWVDRLKSMWLVCGRGRFLFLSSFIISSSSRPVLHQFPNTKLPQKPLSPSQVEILFYYWPKNYFQALCHIIAPAAPMVRQQSSLIITPEWEYSS